MRPTHTGFWIILLVVLPKVAVMQPPFAAHNGGRVLDDSHKFFSSTAQSAIVTLLGGITFAVAQSKFQAMKADITSRSQEVFKATTPGGVCVHRSDTSGSWHYCDEPGFACYNRTSNARTFLSHMKGILCDQDYAASNLAIREVLAVLLQCSCLEQHTSDIGNQEAWSTTTLADIDNWVNTYLVSCDWGSGGARVFSSQDDLTDGRNLTRSQINTGVLRLEATSKLSHLWVQLAMDKQTCSQGCIADGMRSSMGLHPTVFGDISDCHGSPLVFSAEYCRPYNCTSLSNGLAVDTEQYATYGSILAAATDSAFAHFGVGSKSYSEMFAIYTGFFTAMVMAGFQASGHLVSFLAGVLREYHIEIGNWVGNAWGGLINCLGIAWNGLKGFCTVMWRLAKGFCTAMYRLATST